MIKPAMCASCLKSLGVDVASEYDACLRSEIDALCSGSLWRIWSERPFQASTTRQDSQTRARTSRKTFYIPSDSVESLQSAPLEWIQEASRVVERLFTAAGRDLTRTYLKPAMSMWPRQDAHVLTALAELTKVMLEREPFRSSHRELGILLEIVGLADKGSYCQVLLV